MTTRAGRRAAVAAIVVVAVAGAGFGTAAIVGVPHRAPTSESSSAYTSTAAVERGDLRDTKTYAGTIGFGTPVAVPGGASGTITWLPSPGDVLHRDDPVYAVDERPVRAMHGTVPLWRDLRRGLRGADVAQLNTNLAALGYDVAQDDVFGPRTGRAVVQWQKHHGRTATGVLSASDIVFVDGDVRVASLDAHLGEPPGAAVLQVTSTAPVVSLTFAQADTGRFAVGTAVTVLINGTGEPVAGKVVDAAPTDTEGDASAPKTTVTIALEPGDRTLPDAGSAVVEVVGKTEKNVLSVPVAALIAGSSAGGYVVEVQGKNGIERVAVTPGFVADGRVAVTGRLQEGARVVVPS